MCEREVRRKLSKLLDERIIERVDIITGNGRVVYYRLARGKDTEGFINGVFKAVVDLLH